MFGFFTAVAPEGVEVQTDISRFLDFITTIVFAFGIAFEVPIATVLIVWTGFTTPDKLGKARPYVFLGAFVLGMFLTPPDIISQTLLAVPVYLLYELGIVMARVFTSSGDESEEESDSE
jgi:sec-independent protein translocase protein TatC